MTVGGLIDERRGVAEDEGARFRIAVDDAPWPCRDQQAVPAWRELTGGPERGTDTVRIAAADLRSATRAGSAARQMAASQGRRVSIMVDVEVLIADQVAPAMHHLADLENTLAGPYRPTSVMYVGTVQGLVGLLEDIQVLDIADGVTLLALPAGNAGPEIVDEVVALLEQKGLLTSRSA